MRASKGSLVRRLVTGSLGLQVVAALAIAMVVIALRADAGARPSFSLDVKASTVVGGADVMLSMEGPLATSTGSGPCAGGELDSGKLKISDGTHSMSGVLTYGLATAGCVPGFANGVYVEARGFWETASTQEFALTMIARRADDGSLSAVVGDIATSLSYRQREQSDIPQFFTGRFRGAGDWTGLRGTGGTANDTEMVDRLRAELPPVPAGASADASTVDARPGPRFKVGVSTSLLLGEGELTLDASGNVTGGRKDCASGSISKGTLIISDANDRFVANIRDGNVSTCGRKSGDGGKSVAGNADGVMRDAQDTPASFVFTGTIDAKGKITVASGVLYALEPPDYIGKGAAAGSVLDEVDRLRTKVVTYYGATTGGSGTASNLVPPDRPDPTPVTRKYTLSVTGDEGVVISLSSEGGWYNSYPDRRTLILNGPVTATIDGKTFNVQLNRLTFSWESPREGRIQVLGALREPKPEAGTSEPPAGFIIAELAVPQIPTGLFIIGGKATVEGHIAALRIGTRTYAPDVTGTFVVEITAKAGS